MICEKCKKREANINFAREPTFALTHGYGIHSICRQCFIDEVEDELKRIKNNLKKQKELLRKENKK